MSVTEWAALMTAVTGSMAMVGRGGWTIYRDWRARTRRAVTETVSAKNVEIAALKAELKAEKANVRYLRRELAACWGRHK